MARHIPENRFDQLVEGASEVFIARGYRQTQMSDVAHAVGVAKGTLYGYVESKEALFALCLEWADHPDGVERPDTLPVPAPRQGELAARLKAELAQQSTPPKLTQALRRKRADDPRAELTEIVREYYELNERFRRRIKLIDRCHDHPEIGAIWQTAGRETLRAALARYIEKRVRARQFRQVQSFALAARMIVEVVATWAIHIHWDHSPEAFDPDDARENAIEFLVEALVL